MLVLSTLDTLLNTLSNKYNFSIESKNKSKSSSKINFIIDMLPVVKGTNTGVIKGNTVWYAPKQLWVTPDFLDLLLATPPVSYGPVTKEDANLAINIISHNLSGDLNFSSELKTLEGDFDQYFKLLDSKHQKNVDETRRIVKEIENVKKDIFQTVKEIQTKNGVAISKREHAISELEKVLSKSLVLKLKKTILSFSKAEEVIHYLKETLHEVKEEESHPKEDIKDKNIPEFDEGKKNFSKKDILYILNKIHKEPSLSLAKLLENLKSNFNKNLLNELSSAYKKWEGMSGIVFYLSDYAKLKEDLEKHPPLQEVPGDIRALSAHINTVLSFLTKVKKNMANAYSSTEVMSYTEDVLLLLNNYQRSSKKIDEFEHTMSEILRNITTQWNRLNIQDVKKPLQKIRDTFIGDVGTITRTDKEEQTYQKQQQLYDKHVGVPEVLKNLRSLANKKVEINDSDKEIAKFYKNQSKEELKKSSSIKLAKIINDLDSIKGAAQSIGVELEFRSIINELKKVSGS